MAVVVLLALGAPKYGVMAACLAASIRRLHPDTPLLLLHDDTALSDLDSRHLSIVDDVDRLPIQPQRAHYQLTKLRLWELVPDADVLYLDVDQLWISPTQSPAAVWQSAITPTRPVQLVTYGEARPPAYATSGRYTYWIEPRITAKRLQIMHKIPCVNSSVVAYDRDASADYFAACRRLLACGWGPDPQLSGLIPDEWYFGAAAGLVGVDMLPSWRPMYFWLQSAPRHWQLMQKDFACITTTGLMDKTLKKLYNNYAAECLEALDLPPLTYPRHGGS